MYLFRRINWVGLEHLLKLVILSEFLEKKKQNELDTDPALRNI